MLLRIWVTRWIPYRQELAGKGLYNRGIFQRLAIIDIAAGKHEVKDLPGIVDHQVQREPKQKAHGGFG